MGTPNHTIILLSHIGHGKVVHLFAGSVYLHHARVLALDSPRSFLQSYMTLTSTIPRLNGMVALAKKEPSKPII